MTKSWVAPWNLWRRAMWLLCLRTLSTVWLVWHRTLKLSGKSMTSKDGINRNHWLFASDKFRISISECLHSRMLDFIVCVFFFGFFFGFFLLLCPMKRVRGYYFAYWRKFKVQHNNNCSSVWSCLCLCTATAKCPCRNRCYMTCCLDPSLLYSKDLKYSTQTSILLLQYGFSLNQMVEKFVKSNFGISLCSPQLVGVRIPDHNFMRRLCQMCREPLALTSANISSHSSTRAVHVSAQYV